MFRRLANRAVLRRLVAAVVINTAAVQLMEAVLPGVRTDTLRAAFAAAVVIGVVNAVIWPLLVLVALPITTLTLGLGSLVLNGVVVWLAGLLLPGFHVETFLSGIAVAVGMTVINTIITAMLGIDDDDFWYGAVVRRIAGRGGAIASEVPGVVFLEIDGLAHEVLVRAVRNGDVPNIARWLRDGSHRVLRWETDWSSQTGACQAGLLHGSNVDMPAFRWWEKEAGKAIVTNHPRDAMEIERRHSNGKGLLAYDGASRANILSGDAPHSLLTMSTVLRRDRHGRIGQDYFTYFANPYSVARTLVLSIADIANELWSATQQRRHDVRPRIHRDWKYALVRAWATTIQRDLQVASVVGDIYAGRPVVYTTFLAYDEVAHHSGIERHDTLRVLGLVDKQFARLERAVAGAPRPYRFVVLSDHGQSQGATFLQRDGRTLEELVRTASGAASVEAQRQGTEGISFLSSSLTEASEGTGAAAGAVRAATRGRMVDGEVQLDKAERARARRLPGRKDATPSEPPELVVMASGSLGLVYFPREPGRLTLEQLEELFPDVLKALREHPAIGFVMAHSQSLGTVALGARGVNYVDLGRVEGEDPLAPYGPNAARHLKRTDGFAHAADIMVNGAYDPETTEVPAFEELVGSHGGMGGSQSFPFVLYPSDWAAPDQPVVGAETMHRWMRRWLADLGQRDYEEGAAVVAARSSENRAEAQGGQSGNRSTDAVA